MRKPLLIAVKSVLALLLAVVTILLVGFGWLVWRYERVLPDVSQLAANFQTAPICSRIDHRVYVSLAEIPQLLRHAAIAVNGQDFYERVSLNPFVEFAVGLATNRPPRPDGITVAVTRCLMPSDPEWNHGLNWPIGNILLMNQVVRKLSRDRIFEIYLNETYFGRGTYGVAAASEAYFSKPLDRLSIDEIAFIVALPKAPALLDKNRDRATERRNYVVDRMLQTGVISANDAAAARERPLEPRERPPVDPKPEQNP